ncbi:MAG TPA: hypothetical protein VMU80_24145 [Bryobacteraceae bacterium]|nr:hypothetical protein [Bryobacteraceae bacterium]
MEHQNDSELHGLLQEWKAPAAGPSLESRVLRRNRRWWRVLVHGYIRVPVPVACGVAVLMIAGAWRLATVPASGCAMAKVVAPAANSSHRLSYVRKLSAALACAIDSTC